MTGFDDGKDEGALRTIGELGEALGVKSHVLRYWEDQFPMLKPLKRSGGRRYYRPEDVALVREIDRLVNREGYTLRGARTALKDFTPSPDSRDTTGAPAVPPQPAITGDRTSASSSAAVPAEVLASLRSIRTRLAEALAA
jgi:DNA-binding transcriptional MerR regulator